MESMILAVSLMCAAGVPSPASAAEQTRAAETREAYVQKAHAAVDALSAKIDALEAKAEKSGAEARENADDELRALKVRRKTLKKDLVRLKRAGGKAWAKVKAGVDRGIAELEKAYDEAAVD